MKQDYLPQLFPATWKEEYSIYGIDFTNDTCIGFVTREDGAYSYLMIDEINKKGLNTDTLLDNALSNLAELNNNVELKVARPENSTVIWLEADDNFIAVRILLPKIQEFVNKEIGESFLFTIPSRDLLLIWKEDAPELITEKYSREALEDYSEDEYPLSPKIHRYIKNWPCEVVR